jgi:ATP-dependent protease ClpP protease subunit
LLCSALLAGLCNAGAVAAESGRRATTARTSRWWKLTCSDTKASPCRLTVRLRGKIDRSRLRLFEEALRRRGDAERALGRRVELGVDANTHGGEIFAAMEIGRLLRRESASMDIPPGAECSSACIFVLMGATARRVARNARVGIHRPSLGDARSDALVDSMNAQVVLYAEQMQVPERIITEMMAVPAGQMRYLTAAELADWVVLTGEPARGHQPALPQNRP